MCVAPVAVPMHPFKLAVAAVAAFVFVHCASDRREGEDVTETRAALCVAEWTPTWRQGSGANEWWVEYVIEGAPVASAYLEIPGVRNVQLTTEWGKWGASTARIPAGTQVILHAETTSGQRAQTASFGYLTQTTPASDPCTSGGTCEGSFQQGSGANEWWVEYVISGSVRAAHLQIVSGATVTLSPEWGKWHGKPAARIPSGTQVFLHVERTTGQIVETNPFRYLVDTIPTIKPCTGGGDGDTPESGFDTRPSNTTCIAPPRPQSTAPVTLTQLYPSLFSTTTPGRVTSPMMMAQRPGDGSRWFLAQRDGRIVSFNASGTLDLREAVSTAQLASLTGKQVTLTDESGFYTLAFDPSFSTNGRLYVSFSTTCDGSVPICDDPKNINGNYYPYAMEIGYLTSADGGATFTRYTRLMHIGRWAQMHYGGTLVFGKDGFLYITSGDGLDDSAPQYKDNLFGKVLRIDVHGTPAPGKPYGIPPTNPFAAGGGRPEIYAWGVRNPYRMTVDRSTGDLWLGDVGLDSYEEVNRIQLGGNYGWPCREGAHEGHAWNDTYKCPSRSGLIDPVMEHAHGSVGRSVTGGYVYRGSAIAGFQGTYVYGDFIQKELRGLTLSNGVWTSTILNGNGPQDGYVSFAEDVAGEIYAVSLFDQKIHKVVPGSGSGTSNFPQRLSETGCVVASDPTRPAPGLIPYDVNVELWSDGADKERWLAVPNGTKIGIRSDGDFDFPIGTVLVKTFSLGARRVETRLFVRHSDGDWAGYTYEWNDTASDALLLPSGKVKQVGTQSWTFPSRSECLLCHTTAAGRSLGLEIGQLNGTLTYPSTQRAANQLSTLDRIGMFTAPLGDPATLTKYPNPFDGAPSEVKARAYLHANCSGCHRPNGGAARSTMDLRFATPLASTNACNATPIVDNFGSTATRLVKPGSAAESIVSLRMRALDARRMPPLATAIVDARGTGLLDAWIGGLAGCP